MRPKRRAREEAYKMRPKRRGEPDRTMRCNLPDHN